MHVVSRISNGLNNKSSTGLDEISVNILKYCGDAIVPSITSIINNSIASGIFPDELKKARVLPIFKSGDSDIPEKYIYFYSPNFIKYFLSDILLIRCMTILSLLI